MKEPKVKILQKVLEKAEIHFARKQEQPEKDTTDINYGENIWLMLY